MSADPRNSAHDPARTTDLPAPGAPDRTTDLPPLDSPDRTTDLPSRDTSAESLSTGGYTPSEVEAGDPTARPAPPGYEILGVLGRGGMGVVYKARQRGLDRIVALKMILAGPHAGPSVVARFRAEAQAIARFQHPNLVQVFEVGEFEAMPYMALEYVDGGTLAKKIAREPQVPRYAAETVEKLARAMQYAHDRGIAHRDLKPANILLAGDDTPKVTDFGLAKSLEGDSGQTHSGQIMGTPSYMAPEQAEGRPDVGHPADVYALGAILYDLLTGRPPFAGSSVLDTLEMVRAREPVPPSELTAKLPRDLETICLKCLQKEPSKRYATAGDLAEDLENYLDGRPIVARPVGRVERAWRWARRNPAGAGVIGLFGALFVVLAVSAVLLSVSEAKATDAKNLAETKRQEAEDALAKESVALAKEKQAVTDKDAALVKERAAVVAKEQARAAEEAAKDAATANGALYAAQRNETLLTVREVLREIDGLMRGKAALAPLRVQIVNKMLARLNAIVPPNERSVLDARTEAIAYSRMGGIFYETNNVERAAEWIRKAHTLLVKLAADNPTDPAALFNLSAISHQLADAEWRLGHSARARELHAAALNARQARVPLIEDLIKRKKATEGNLNDARFLVADSYGLLAFTDLSTGDPVAAIENYTASDKGFAALKTAGTLDVRRRRTEVQVRLGDAKLALSRPDEAEKHYRAALAERETLLKLTPESAGFGPALRDDLAHTRTYLGDFLLAARKDPLGAKEQYDIAFDLYAAALKLAPDDLALQRRVAALHYRLGYVAGRRSGFAAAAGPAVAAWHFAECLRMRESLAKIDPRDTQPKIELMLALGRAGRAAEAEKLAKELLALKVLAQPARFQAVCGLSVAAGRAADPELKKRCTDLAFAALADLVRTWKARGQLETEPDLDALRADPRFAALVAPK